MTDAITTTPIVEKHKVITFIYLIKDADGHVREQSDIPMAYVHGADTRVVQKVADALAGHKVGDKVVVDVPPADGFGERDERLFYRDVLANVPPKMRKIGAEASFQNDAGESRTLRVTKIAGGMIELDGNHPYAGKTMTFEVTIRAIRHATPDEIGSGEVNMNTPRRH